MKQLSVIFFVVILQGLIACGSSGRKEKTGKLPEAETAETYLLKRDSMHVRDPFIFVDRENGFYYMQANGGKGFRLYKSRDLEHWKDLGFSFKADTSFWGKRDFWAPDMYQYEGKYFIFGTFSGRTEKRGTSILVSDNPEGPYQPLVNKAVTPAEWMCLDGALYIDDGRNPWILYCHEWLETTDGEIIAQRLSPDLKEALGEPHLLFKAGDAEWTGTVTGQGVTGYVTDAPFVIELDDGTLTMLWSSMRKSDGRYCIGQAYSRSGNILGPWELDPVPLNEDDGGHAMLFRDLNGSLKISYHAPNSGKSIPRIRPVKIEANGRII